MTLDAEKRQIVFDEPYLPSFLDDILLRNLSLGNARADILLRRSGSKVVVEVLKREGDLKVFSCV